MSTSQTASILLTPDMQAIVERALEERPEATGQQVVGDALKLYAERTQFDELHLNIDHLRRKYDEALANPGPGLDPEPVFERLREKFAARAQAAGDSGK